MLVTGQSVSGQSVTDEFWQYAKEAVVSAATAKTDDDRQSLLELARTWTQAALQERRATRRIRPFAGLNVIRFEQNRLSGNGNTQSAGGEWGSDGLDSSVHHQ
jgi:hypothetical protein